MLIDDLNECENRIKAAEVVIGDLKNSDLIDLLTRNERMKDSMLQEIEDLHDRSEELDGIIKDQDQEIAKLENFINSPNGLNQQKVAELENELIQDEEHAEQLIKVIEELKVRADSHETNLINYDKEYLKKNEDFHDLNMKLVENDQKVKHLKNITGIHNLQSELR